MSQSLIEIAEDTAGWTVRVDDVASGTFAWPSEAVKHARSLSQTMELAGGEPRIRVYFTQDAQRSRAV